MSTSEHLRAFQQGNKQGTIDKIVSAMQTIEAELEEHGYYPENQGRINRREVCRRAGVGSSTLKNKTHGETAARVNRWLIRVKKRAPTLKPKAEDAKHTRIVDLVAQLNRIAQHYNKFKIQYDAICQKNGELEEENASLKRQLAQLLSVDTKIVSLPIKRGEGDPQRS